MNTSNFFYCFNVSLGCCEFRLLLYIAYYCRQRPSMSHDDVKFWSNNNNREIWKGLGSEAKEKCETGLGPALPLIGFSPQIWGFRPDLGFWGFPGFFKKNLGFFWGFSRFPRKIHILECFLLESKWFFVKKGKKT